MRETEWVISVSGRTGPNTWHTEQIIKAKDIREALNQAEPLAREAGGEITGIMLKEEE